jgi:hypothetical protein
MVLVGLDPGGRNAFGWCVVDDGAALPLRVRSFGVANDADEALRAVDAVAGSDIAVAAGIDAPLFWTTSGDRNVDAHVRQAICRRGASSGTVGHVSSLRGACLVQGVLAAALLQQRWPGLPLTEAHPKAALWMLGDASKTRKPATLAMTDLARYFDVSGGGSWSEHSRDAALGALAAWAMLHRAPGWSDIRKLDPSAVSPLGAAAAYWVPSFDGDSPR